MEGDPTFYMEDDLIFLVDGRQPRFFCKWKITSFLLIEDDHNGFVNGRRPNFWEMERDQIIC